MRGFIDDYSGGKKDGRPRPKSQSAFMRGFIDDRSTVTVEAEYGDESQSAFMRGFIDDNWGKENGSWRFDGLNPRSCAASSMTVSSNGSLGSRSTSQSAFMRGFIDDDAALARQQSLTEVSIRVHARLHR